MQQKSALFRPTPWFLDSLLDSPKLLNWLSRRSAGMEVAKLGALTVSTLSGQQGRQRKEIDKLLRWLARDVKPDVIHLSNIMLAGIAPALRERLNVPIITTLSGEDIFLEQLKEPHYSQARWLLKRQADKLDGFVALNNYFADFMADYLAVDRERIEVIPQRVESGWLRLRPPRAKRRKSLRSAISPAWPREKGLHISPRGVLPVGGPQ